MRPGRSHMPRTSRRSSRKRMETTWEMDGKPADVTLAAYENRRYAAKEIAEAKDFFSQLNPEKKPYVTKRCA
eukprot:SAG22_NODE_1406_length_4490_cov_5.574357_1_plen_72_part_00